MKSVNHQLSSEWKKVKWVLTDVDDTLTWNGSLPPETLISLDKLRSAGIKVVAVTGACSGWCDHIAQLWPVDAVIGENGAVLMTKQNGHLHLETSLPLQTMRKQQEKLKQEIAGILEDYPDLHLTLDQAYRVCEVSIDIGQNRPKVEDALISEVTARIHKLGAHATASSIHINAWYGDHSKKASSLAFLRKQGLSEEDIVESCCYVGDSLNDQAMFATLPLSAGVANIAHYWDRLTFSPAVVMEKPGGFGFSEFAEKLLALKN